MESSEDLPRAAGSSRTLEDRVSELPRVELLSVLLGLAGHLKESAEGGHALDQELLKAEHRRDRLNLTKVSGAKAVKQSSKKPKPFDMSKYKQRHVALQLQYDGSKFYGFAAQKDEFEETVEKHLFEALLKLRLIESRQTCNYSRCGRTDKGVSALRQVVAFDLRSNIPKECSDISGSGVTELDYCNMLNKSLPPEIRALGVSFVSPDFSARFSATYRTYRYFFVRRTLNTEAMLVGAKNLIGVHDFRNFCKLDAANVTNFEREILFVNLVCYQESPVDKTHDIMYLEISRQLESPDIVMRLVDVAVEPAKPDYSLAEDAPLLLYDCGFKNTDFQYNPKVLKMLEAHYEEQWERSAIAGARARTSLDWIQGCTVQSSDVDAVRECMHRNNKQRKSETKSPPRKRQKLDSDADDIVTWGSVKSVLEDDITVAYTPLLQRARGEVYEVRQARLSGAKKERLGKHVSLQGQPDSDQRNSDFFAKMRGEGSIKDSKCNDIIT